MIEVTYEDFQKNMDDYFKATASGKECIAVTRDGQRIVMVESVDYSILVAALDIARLTLKR